MTQERFDPHGFIDSQQWTFAKTMPTNPHSYVVRGKGHDPEEFDSFVRFIRRNGQERVWGRGRGRKIFIYWTDDAGRRYWTMGWPAWRPGLGKGQYTFIINRVEPQHDQSIPRGEVDSFVPYSSPDGSRPT